MLDQKAWLVGDQKGVSSDGPACAGLPATSAFAAVVLPLGDQIDHAYDDEARQGATELQDIYAGTVGGGDGQGPGNLYFEGGAAVGVAIETLESPVEKEERGRVSRDRDGGRLPFRIPAIPRSPVRCLHLHHVLAVVEDRQVERTINLDEPLGGRQIGALPCLEDECRPSAIMGHIGV